MVPVFIFLDRHLYAVEDAESASREEESLVQECHHHRGFDERINGSKVGICEVKYVAMYLVSTNVCYMAKICKATDAGKDRNYFNASSSVISVKRGPL